MAAKERITFDGSAFSDGTYASYSVGKRPRLYVDVPDGDMREKPMSHAHLAAVLEPSRDVVLRLDTSGSLPDRDVKLRAPVTAKKVFDAMSSFYARRITPSDYAYMESRDELRKWNGSSYPDWPTFKRKIRQYGALKGDYVAYSGLAREDGLFGRIFGRIFGSGPAVYSPLWSS